MSQIPRKSSLDQYSSPLMQSFKFFPLNRFFRLVFLSTFVFSLLSSAEPRMSQHSALSKRILGRGNRMLQENQSPYLIGTLDTFAYTPKFLKVDVFDILVKDRMVLKCYSDGKCTFAQTIKYDNSSEFEPQVETLDGAKLVPIWKALSLLNVLALRKEMEFSEDMMVVLEDFKEIFQVLLEYKGQAVELVQEFLDAIVQIIADKLSQVDTTVLLNLNDVNSDLSLQFQNLLANSFNIIVGKYLQIIASDYGYFDNTLTQILYFLENDISINTNTAALLNYTDRQTVLNNIEEIRQNYSLLCQEFIDAFKKYQEIQANWTEIIKEQIKLQIIDKFNFPSANITQAVQNFLIMIIEDRRNLITDTGSLISQQLDQYTAHLTQNALQKNQTLQNDLDQLIEILNKNPNPTSTEDVISVFVQESAISVLFNVTRTVNPLDSLTQLTTEEFAIVLQQFQALFMEYITNLPQIIELIKAAFREKFDILVLQLEQLHANVTAIYSQEVANLWQDIFKVSNDSSLMIAQLQSENYTLTAEEQEIYQSFNLFNETIETSVQELQSEQDSMGDLADEAIELYNSLVEEFNFTFNTSLPFITTEIKENITLLMKEVEKVRQEHLQVFNGLLKDIEAYLGMDITTDINLFFDGLLGYVEVKYQLLKQIIEAVLTNDFSKITLVSADVLKGIVSKLGDSFTEFHLDMTSQPLEYFYNTSVQLVNVSENGIQSNLVLSLRYHHIITGVYEVENNSTMSKFTLKIIPQIELHIDIWNRIQEFYLFRDVLTTSLDLLNGTFPVSFNLMGQFGEGNHTLSRYIEEEMKMNDLSVLINEEQSVFLAHNETEDPVILSKTVSFEDVQSIVGSESCTL